MSALKDLAAMFDGRGDGPGWPPEAGWKPWWPMASDVWRRQGKPPDSDWTAGTDQQCWAQAWELLQRLEAEYRESRGSRLRE